MRICFEIISDLMIINIISLYMLRHFRPGFFYINNRNLFEPAFIFLARKLEKSLSAVHYLSFTEGGVFYNPDCLPGETGDNNQELLTLAFLMSNIRWPIQVL